MINFKALALQRARLLISGERLAQIHGPVESAITAIRAYLGQIPPDDEYFDVAADNELPYLEDLLGVAFVACQTQLTSVRTAMQEVSDLGVRAGGTPISFLGGGKGYDIFTAFNPVEPKSRKSRMQVINAIANYWKHHEEWPTKSVRGPGAITLEWDIDSAGQAQVTIETVTALGMEPHSNQNIHQALSELGISDPANLSQLRAWIDTWSDLVLTEAAMTF